MEKRFEITPSFKGKLTKPLGEQMSELPINPTLSKMLFNSGEFECVQEMAIIVAMLQVGINLLKFKSYLFYYVSA